MTSCLEKAGGEGREEEGGVSGNITAPSPPAIDLTVTHSHPLSLSLSLSLSLTHIDYFLFMN